MLLALQLIAAVSLVAAVILCADFIMSGMDEALDDPSLDELPTSFH